MLRYETKFDDNLSITSSYLDQSQIDKLNSAANVFGFAYSTYKETYQLLLALTNNQPNQVETISDFGSISVQYFINYIQQGKHHPQSNNAQMIPKYRSSFNVMPILQ
jgi:hypothetical protein